MKVVKRGKKVHVFIDKSDFVGSFTHDSVCLGGGHTVTLLK